MPFFADGDQVLSSSSPSTIHQPITSQIVYDAITQKLKTNGQIKPQPINDAVDLSVKTNEAPDSDHEDGVAVPLTIQKVMESIRQRWQNVQQSRLGHDVIHEPDNDEILTLRVPACVKSVVIERDGKKQKFELN